MIAYEKIQLKNKLEVYALPVNKNSDVISVDIFIKWVQEMRSWEKAA